MVALYRPGPMDSIPDFIDAKHGRKEITYLDPKLEPILGSTYGVIVTQDQVLQIARFFAGFTYGQADILRKAVGKKIFKLLDEQKVKFIEGAIKEGASHKTAQAVWDFIEPFAKYGFNRAHAACYAMIAYQTAYLKAHFPSAFMAAWLTAEQQNIDKIAFAIGECQRMGIAVLPPNVNESFLEFGVVKSTGNIRFGLAAIKNVGVGVSDEIVEERKNNGPYLTLGDFIIRLSGKVLNKKVIEALAKCGALDDLAERNQIIMQIENILKFISSLDKSKSHNQMNLFAAAAEGVPVAELKLENVEPAPQKQRLAWEKELLGIYLSEHPLKELALRLGSLGMTIAELETLSSNLKVKFAGVISVSRKIMTKNKEPMMFLTVEDLTGKIEVIVFPRTLAADPQIWITDEPIMIEGRLDRKENVAKVIAQSAKKFDEVGTNNTEEAVVAERDTPKVAGPEKIVITLPSKAQKDILLKIKEILKQFLAEDGVPGLDVYLKVPKNMGYEEIKTKTTVVLKSNLTRQLQEILDGGQVEII
jgi:DNA polymerase-3 subunit alpha